MADTHYGLGLVYRAQGRREAAEEALAQASELESIPGLTPQHFRALYAALKRHERGEEWDNKIAELVPDDAQGLNSLAWFLYLIAADPQKAEALARRAVALEPTHSAILHTLAAIQLTHASWDYASDTVLAWLRHAGPEHVTGYRSDTLETFRLAVSLGKAAALETLLRQLDTREMWTPWIEALASLSGKNTPDGLSTEARAIREALSKAQT